MIAKHSFSGRPDFMPRTTMSTALGSSRVNFVCRRTTSLFTNQRGTPNTPMRPTISDSSMRVAPAGSDIVTMKASIIPQTTLANQ